MAELLRDYSGGFNPNFGYDKLDRETLVRLLNAYSEYMRRIDAHWYLAVMEKFGNDEALDCDGRVWEKLVTYEMKVMSDLFDIRGNDVATVMKALQVSPWTWVYDCDIDLKSDTHSVVTYRNCPTLLALEKEGLGREGVICRELEPRLMGLIAGYFNPDITVTALKLPPREPGSDLCCQWEFSLER